MSAENLTFWFGLLVFGLVLVLIRPLLARRRRLPWGQGIATLARRLHYRLVPAPQTETFDFVADEFEVLRGDRPETPERESGLRIRPYYLFDQGSLCFHVLRIEGIHDDFRFLEAVRSFVGKAEESVVDHDTLPATVSWARLFVSRGTGQYLYAAALRVGGYIYRVGPLGIRDPVLGVVG